ncbi:class C beta-lactamase [Pseudomonas sp. nanlin1]|uniref:class C beta-lactamase n=1 Tax=Pseudomonas sp. nanlin1 TaxID=3040605 RepID=UPI00388FA967
MRLTAIFCFALSFSCGVQAAASAPDAHVRAAAERVIAQYDIPGLAIAVSVNGQQHFYNFGVASWETQQAVDESTLFELGSVSKTFTATLAQYAQAKGLLALDASAARYVPQLAGSAVARARVLDLATYTAGGLPLQFPDEISSDAQALDYLKAWQPSYAPGTHRTYSNPSIGLLGIVAARALQQPFPAAIQQHLFSPLGLRSTYLDVPQAQRSRYAQGYTKDNQPVRVNPGPLAAQAYGIKTNSNDLLRFIEANLGRVPLERPLQEAIVATRTGYFTVGAMTQGMVWEQYPDSVTLEDLAAGNASSVALATRAVQPLQPARPPQAGTWVNKTGSTNGFGAYVAFVPSKQWGIVILANRNYPNEARARLARQIAELL